MSQQESTATTLAGVELTADLGMGEELARAEVYGLLAELFYAPLRGELFEQLRVAVTEAPSAGAFLETHWSELVAAARRLSLDEINDEFVALFGGVGKPEICVYGSFYLTGFLNQQPLVELRRDLEVLGLERPAAVLETEDHIATLSEVMRYLIAGDDAGVSNLAGQQRFFNAHLRAWVEQFCDALALHPRADFYRAVAVFARDFFAVEAQGFDLLEV
ncbi:TorD/DmsD family molecular chaperone [Paucibacter hankyongi]|uniref:TorD/DmsD family molecular chaperone n=1 Tax=Paucibacter hankyongi TaxID=3133434 RepID=UPI004035B1DF